MKSSIVILGTGGFALELFHMMLDVGVNVIGCLGPTPCTFANWLGDDSQIPALVPNNHFLIAVGNIALRAQLSDKLTQVGAKLGTFRHPNCYVNSTAKLCDGTILYPNTSLHSGVFLGTNSFVNSGATIGHETAIGARTVVGPNVAIGGGCKIEPEVYLGLNCSVIEDISIAKKVKVGAGAVVVRDITDPDITVVGIPARKLN